MFIYFIHILVDIAYTFLAMDLLHFSLNNYMYYHFRFYLTSGQPGEARLGVNIILVQDFQVSQT